MKSSILYYVPHDLHRLPITETLHLELHLSTRGGLFCHKVGHYSWFVGFEVQSEICRGDLE